MVNPQQCFFIKRFFISVSSSSKSLLSNKNKPKESPKNENTNMLSNNRTNAFYSQRFRQEDAKLLREPSKRGDGDENKSQVSALTQDSNNANNQKPSSDKAAPPSPVFRKQQTIHLTKNVLQEGAIPTPKEYLMESNFNSQQRKNKNNNNRFTITKTATMVTAGKQQQQSIPQSLPPAMSPRNQPIKTSNTEKPHTSRASVCSESSGLKSCRSATAPELSSSKNNNVLPQQQQPNVASSSHATDRRVSETATPTNLSKKTLESWVNSVPSELPPIPTNSARASAVSGQQQQSQQQKKKTYALRKSAIDGGGGTETDDNSDGQSVFSATTLSHHAASSALVSGVSTINRRLEAIEQRIAGEKELRNDLRKALQEVRQIVEKQKKLETNMKNELNAASSSQLSGKSSGILRKK